MYWVDSAIMASVGIMATWIGFRGRAGIGVLGKHHLRWLGPFLVAFAIVLFIGQRAMHKSDQEETAPSVAAGIKRLTSLPMRVDDVTYLTDVRAHGEREIDYLLDLTNVSKAQNDAQPVQAKLEARMRGVACKNPDFATLLSGGFSVGLIYSSNDHHEVARITIAPGDCPR